jgi:GNAT superfamily N-acetyltransferase
MLPFAGSREEGNLQLAAPGFVYDAARAFVTPGMAARGQQVSDQDILDTAMNVMGGGVGASRVAGPRAVPDEVLLGMGVGSRDTPTAADDLAALKKMTRSEFLGSPKIVGAFDASELRPIAIGAVEDAPAEEFIHGLTLRKSPEGAAVFDGDKVVASYNFGNTLVVDPKYRKKGIAEELVYRWRSAYPEPATARTRTKVSQKIQENVWERMQREQASTPLQGPAKRDSSNITFAKGGLASKSNVERVNNDNRRYLG